MAITYHKGMLVAQAVVSLMLTMQEHYEDQIVGEQRSYEKGIDATIKGFVNCREQGLAVHVNNAPISKTIELDGGRGPHTFHTDTVYFISEYRSSDNIVVYVGTADISGNPDDSAWDNAKFFRYDEHYKAAEWIMEDAVTRINAALADQAAKKEAEYSETFAEHMTAAQKPELKSEVLRAILTNVRKATTVQDVNKILKALPDDVKQALNYGRF